MPTLRQHTLCLATALQAVYPPEEAAAIANEVLGQLLQLTPLQRSMQAREEVAATALADLPTIQARLLHHEPLQYVLGVAHFAGLELEVTPATLIPRPETEELVALIVQEQRGRSNLRILDVGTGSGCIPLALAQALPGSHLTAVDISAEALAVACRNARKYAAAVDFQLVDILQATPMLDGPLDILVSNPPYVLENERPLMRPNVLNYEPATALFVPDHDPLRFYRRIAELGQTLLAAGGALYFEINEQFARETVEMLHQLRYTGAAAHVDIFGKSRMVRAIWPG